MQSFATSSR